MLITFYIILCVKNPLNREDINMRIDLFRQYSIHRHLKHRLFYLHLNVNNLKQFYLFFTNKYRRVDKRNFIFYLPSGIHYLRITCGYFYSAPQITDDLLCFFVIDKNLVHLISGTRNIGIDTLIISALS